MQSGLILSFALVAVLSEARPPWNTEPDGGRYARRHGGIREDSQTRHPIEGPFPPLKENPTVYQGNRIIMFIGEGTWRCNYQRVLIRLMENPSEIQRIIERCFVPTPSDSSSAEDDSTEEGLTVLSTVTKGDDEITLGTTESDSHEIETGSGEGESPHGNIDISSHSSAVSSTTSPLTDDIDETTAANTAN